MAYVPLCLLIFNVIVWTNAADFAIMVHQQQGWFWQFGKSLKPRSETVNGMSMQNARPLPTTPAAGDGAITPASANAEAVGAGMTVTDGVNHHIHHHHPAAMDSSQQRPPSTRNVSTPNPGSSITIP